MKSKKGVENPQFHPSQISCKYHLPQKSGLPTPLRLRHESSSLGTVRSLGQHSASPLVRAMCSPKALHADTRHHLVLHILLGHLSSPQPGGVWGLVYGTAASLSQGTSGTAHLGGS